MPNRIIFSSKTKVGIEAGKIPTSVDVLLQTDNSPNMDDFRNWASDTSALISLNKTLQNEGIGNTSSGSQYYNRYGSANLYQTKLIPSTDYAGRSVAAQGDNRSWIRKDYIENYQITARGSQDRSKSIFVVNSFSQTEKLISVVAPSLGGQATDPPTQNITGNPPQIPYTFDGSFLRKRTDSTANIVGSTSLVLTTTGPSGTNYGTNVATYGIYPGSAVSGTGIPSETFVSSTYTAAVWPNASSLTIPLVDSQGLPVALTEDCNNETVYFEIPEGVKPPGVPHLITVNGVKTPVNGGTGSAIPNTTPVQYYPSATFAVYYDEDANISEIFVVDSGNGYSSLNQSTTNRLVIPGSFVGGDDGDNDITITSYTLNTFSILVTTTDFQDKNINLQDVINSEETGVDLFSFSGVSAGSIVKSSTMVSGNTFITVTNTSLIEKGMTVTSSTGLGIPADTIVADSYVPGSTTVPLAQLNGITPQKVTFTYSTAINVTFKYSSTFTNVSGTTISGSGSGATFIVTKNNNNTYNVFKTNPGSSYTPNSVIRILGTAIGGTSPANDLTITVLKSLSKFPSGTRVTFFEKSVNNPGYYDLYLNNNPLPGLTFSRSSSLSGNDIGNTSIIVTSATSIAAGQNITGLTTDVTGVGVYVGDNYISGSTTIPLTEADGITPVSLTQISNNLSLVFSANTVIENGDGLVFFRSYNSFWSQLNSGSIFEGIPTNYIAWYRGTKLTTKQIPVTLVPNDLSSVYPLYTQRFRVDSTTNLATTIQPNSDWALFLQYGKNLDPKWETLTIVNLSEVTSLRYTGTDNKIHYITEIVVQYPSKYSWNLITEPLSYCYVYRNVLGGIFSDYIPQTVPFNKAYIASEYLWKAPTSINIQVSGSFGGVSGAIYRLSSVNESITASTPIFRIADKDTYSMYIKTWRDLIQQTATQTNSNQIKLTSTASDPRYIYLNPRNIVFRSLVNNNTYVSFETGNLNLGSRPEINPNVSYTNDVLRLDTYASYAPQSPGIYTYSFGRQVIYFEYFAWNYYLDGLQNTNVYTGNPTTQSLPYKFLSTTPYSQPAEMRATGSTNAVRVDLIGHGFQAGDRVLFNNNLPAGVASGSIDQRGNRFGTIYYVSATNLTTDSFQFSLTSGGASVTSSSGSAATPDIRTNVNVIQPIQLVSDITSNQTTGIQVTGMHGLVIRGSYKIQAGTTEPIQLQDQFYYIKREFPNRESIDGDPKTITSITRTSGSTTVTVITSTGHGLANGDRVVITTTNNTVNTTEESPAIVTQVVNGTQFRYTTTGQTSAVSLTTGIAQPRSGWNRYIKINNEIISFDYYSIDGNNRYTLYGVQRGQLGTTASAQTANTTSGGRDFSIAFDTWSPSGVRVQNSIFNTDGTLKPNITMTLQNNWTYTRDFPDYGGTNGLLYYGAGRRDATVPSRWEVALYGPGYFAPGLMSSVSFPSSAVEPARTSGSYTVNPSTTTGIGSAAQLIIKIGYVSTQSGIAFSSGVSSITLTDNTDLVSGLKIIGSGIQTNTFIGSITGSAGNYTVTLVDSTGTVARPTNSAQTSTTLDFYNATGNITALVNNSGQNYKKGDTVTVNGSSIGGGSNVLFTVVNVNAGTLWDGMDYCQPGIAKKINKNPFYQALYKESSEVKYYQEPAEANQRSYEDIFGSFTQAMVKTKNIVSGIPDDTTPYYNVRSSADAILLQASRDQYFAYLSGLIKRPKYLTAATTINSNVLKLNDAVGIEVGDTIYGPGISPDGAIIKSITGDQYFTLSYRNGVIKVGNGIYRKTSGSWGWNADAYSNTGYTTNVYAQAQAFDRSNWLMFGLNSDPLTNSSYDSLDYAWYFTNGGGLYIYENGNYIGYYGVYYASTECKVEYNGTFVTYYKDGIAQRSVSRSQGVSLYFDSSFYSIGGALTKVKYGSTTTVSSNNAEATIELRQKRVVTKDIVVRKYELINTESLGDVCRLTIDNAYNISQPQVQNITTGPFKYYVSEIKFEYVDPAYQAQFRTFFFEEDKYSSPILKTEIQNSTGYLFLYLKNPILLSPKTKEKYDSSLYALKSKIEVVTFEDYKLNPDIDRVGIFLSTPTITGITTSPIDTAVTYTNISASSTTGGGTGATFNIVRTTSTNYNVTINNTGTNGYTTASVLTINGALIGGTTPNNNLTINVTDVSGGAITNFSVSGTAVPSNPSGAEFTVTRNSDSTYTVVRTNGGTGYANGNILKILGTKVGCESPDNDITITITGVTNGVINSNGFTYTGTSLAPNKIAISSTTGISTGMSVETYNPGGLITYTGVLPSGTIVTSVDSDSVITVSNAPSVSGSASLKLTSSVTYAVGTPYTIDPSPNLYKNSRYILDTARSTYFTSKWNNGSTELDLYFSPDINDPSSSINYLFNFDDPVKYYAVDSGDRLIYNISSITYNGTSSVFNRISTDTGFGNLAVNQKVYFTNIPAGVSLSENTPYYILNPQTNSFQISSAISGAALSVTAGSTVSNTYLKMRRVYDSGIDKNQLRTSLTYFDYQVNSSINEIPSGEVQFKTVATNGGTINDGQVISQTTSGTAKTSYTGIGVSAVSSSGINAAFDVTKSAGKYGNPALSASGAGSGYKPQDTLRILGSNLGGVDSTNDIAITVSTTSAVSFTGISSTTTSGTGSGATFNVSRNCTSSTTGAYTVTLSNGGSSYSNTSVLRILGTSLGGASPTNDITITVTGVTGGVINSNGFTISGTPILSNPIATFTHNGGSAGAANARTSYTALTGTVTTGTGSGATYTVTVSGTSYSVSRTADGSGYTSTSVITIPGTSLGGSSPLNDLSITTSSVSTGGSRLLVTNGLNIKAGMYVVSNTSGIPALSVVASSYVSGSTTVPLTDINGNSIALTTNMSGTSIFFTNGSVRIYGYDGISYNTYPYIGVAYRSSATGIPAEVSSFAQLPSATYSDQMHFTFTNNTLPQELYPYAKVEVSWPSITLSESVAPSDTIVKVNGIIPDGYPDFGNIKIGTERIYYGYKSSNFFGDCVVKFPHTAGDIITHSPNYTIKVDGLLQNGCSQNTQTKLIAMSPTPSTGVGYSGTSAQTLYVAGFEMDTDPTNAISFPSYARYYAISDKLNAGTVVTVNRTGNSIALPANAIKTGQTINDGDEIILQSTFGLGSGYKIVSLVSTSRVQLNKPTVTDTTSLITGVSNHRRLFTVDSDIISGMNDTFIDTATNFNSKKGLKFVGLSGCTDFKPVKCSKTKYATVASNKYSNTVTLADNLTSTTYTLTGLSSYYSSGSTKATGVKSVLFYDGEDYEIKSINGRVVTLVQPLKQRIRFRDAVTIKSDGYIPEFERVPNVKGLVYGPQKAIFYDRYRAAQVTVTNLGYNGNVNRFRWRLQFTYGVPSGLSLFDKISSNLNYNDYYISCLPSSSEQGVSTNAIQIIVSSSSGTFPTNSTNQNLIYISKPNGYIARDFESASMQIGGYKNASRQQIVPTQILAESTGGAIADIEAVSTRATRDIFTGSLGEVLGRFIFKSVNFSSTNRPNLWRNTITPPSGMNVRTGRLLSYLINETPNFITFRSQTNSNIFYGNTSTWNSFTATGVVINDIGLDTTNSRILYACSSNTIRWAAYSSPTSLNSVTISGSGTNTYITYVNGYYFVGNSNGVLYYSTNLSTWNPIITGNTSQIVGVYYDEFKYIITHERVSGSGTIYKNYTMETVGGTLKGLTNLFAPRKTISSVFGFGKILESGYTVFDGSTYSSPAVEVYEYENFTDYTSDDISDDFNTNGLSFNFGQFIAYGQQTSTLRQFAKFSSNARTWSTIDFDGNISVLDEITGLVYGGYNTYAAIVWNAATSTNKILISSVKPSSSSDLTPSDIVESGRYRKIEDNQSVKLYKFRTTATSQEGNLLVWNGTNLIWLKSLFGSPIKSNEFTDYKPISAENYIAYTKNTRILPNLRSTNDLNGASRPITIYNDQLPLGTATVANNGGGINGNSTIGGYEYNTYTNVSIQHPASDSTYGTSPNYATATVVVTDTGIVSGVYVDTGGDYYTSTTGLNLINGTGTPTLNYSRTVNKAGVSWVAGDSTVLTGKTINAVTAGASSITVSNASGIEVGMEVYSTTGGTLAQTTYYVSLAYNSGATSVPLVTAAGLTASLPAVANGHGVTFRKNIIRLPSGTNVSGILPGMGVSISGAFSTQIPSGTIVLSNYRARKSGDDNYEGPQEIPVSRPPAVFTNQTVIFTVSGNQATVTTSSTALDTKTFTLNGSSNNDIGYVVIFRNTINGIDYIALFFNSSGHLIDCISDLKFTDISHLTRTEAFAQGL